MEVAVLEAPPFQAVRAIPLALEAPVERPGLVTNRGGSWLPKGVEKIGASEHLMRSRIEKPTCVRYLTVVPSPAEIGWAR